MKGCISIANHFIHSKKTKIMKKFQILSFAAAAILVFGFTSCLPEEPVDPVNERTSIWIGLYKRFSDCYESTFICIRAEYLTAKEALSLPQEVDHAVSEPLALADGAVELAMEVNTNHLSPFARQMLFSEKLMAVDEDIVLSEGVMRQAYENAGLVYEGQRMQLPKGVYPVSMPDFGDTPPLKIIIIITISKDKITITVKW
jgi:hypothetical protein